VNLSFGRVVRLLPYAGSYARKGIALDFLAAAVLRIFVAIRKLYEKNCVDATDNIIEVVGAVCKYLSTNVAQAGGACAPHDKQPAWKNYKKLKPQCGFT
jgi:hypothetical protein